MKLVNDPKLPNANDGFYSNRFKVNDIVIRGQSSHRSGTRGVIVKVMSSSTYRIKWPTGVETIWSDYQNWIIPDPKPTIIKEELINTYEI